MSELFKIESEKKPLPAVAVVNGKWSYFGDPVSLLDEAEKGVVFQVICSAINAELDRKFISKKNKQRQL